MRVRDLVVRWGGEEFVILLPNTDLVTAEKIAERLKAEVQNNTGTTISLGVSYSDSHPDFDAVMYAAEQGTGFGAKPRLRRQLPAGHIDPGINLDLRQTQIFIGFLQRPGLFF